MKSKLKNVFDFYPFTMSDAPRDRSDQMNQTFANEHYVVMWLLAICLIFTLFTKFVALWLTFGTIFAAGLFFSGSVRMRTLISCIMLPALLGVTAAIAWFSSVPEDHFNWMFSKLMFVSYFGIYGMHLAERFNWEKYNGYALVLGGAMFLLAYYLRFHGHQDAGEIVCVSMSPLEKTCFALKSSGPTTSYGPRDWYEDVLLGVTVILYAVIIPKALKQKAT